MSFLPPGRYAQMRNVFFLPSPDTLQSWLEKTGFELVSRSSLDATSVTEQRSTAWMPHPSLDSFLQATSADPDAHDRRTSEGHLRPHRVIMIAKSKSP
jgi:tRNA (mo5U34)-methyltransferase